MGRFQLVRPTTVAEGVAELDRLGDQARIYAGGAELLLLMRNNVVQPDHLIDIKRIAGLDELAWDGNVLRIGATVTHRRLERDEHVRRGFPAFADAESRIGNIRVRTQGTLGGNLCFADPHADPATPLLVHDTVTTVAGPMGTREIPLADLITGTYETALEPNEILTRVDVPPLPEAWRESFHRIERYYRPTANVAVAARISGGTIADLRMAVGCIGPRATRLAALEDELRGSTVAEADARVAAAAPELEQLLEPVDDLLGTAAYKVLVAVVLLRRALAEVVGTAKEERS